MLAVAPQSRFLAGASPRNYCFVEMTLGSQEPPVFEGFEQPESGEVLCRTGDGGDGGDGGLDAGNGGRGGDAGCNGDVSMDGRGRWIDNRFIERLWCSAKYEDIYVQDYSDGLTAQRGLNRWFEDYNLVRPHQALNYATPGDLYLSPGSHGAKPAAWAWK